MFLKSLVFETGLATQFSNNDKWNPNIYAVCLHRDLRETDHIIAHKSLPCNSKLLLYNPRTGLMTLTKVGDRGPVRSDLDLNSPVAKAINFNGYEKIIMVYRQ